MDDLYDEYALPLCGAAMGPITDIVPGSVTSLERLRSPRTTLNMASTPAHTSTTMNTQRRRQRHNSQLDKN